MSTGEAFAPKYTVDAKTFQHQLSGLTDTLAYKVEREGPQHGLKPDFVELDIFVLLKYAQETYRLFFFMNADKRRKEDVEWRIPYSIVMIPLVRTMIDCLYNVTAILASPGKKGYQFRESGYKRALQALDADEKRYGGDPDWDAHIAKSREMIRHSMARDGITDSDISEADEWPTLGRYLKVENGEVPTQQQEFLRKLTYGFWQEYSGMAHATFQGLLPIAMYLVTKELPHDDRPRVDQASERIISRDISRVAGILLCTLTEVQAHCRFDGARIDERLREIWNALLPIPEIKELYDERYAKLLR